MDAEMAGTSGASSIVTNQATDDPKRFERATRSRRAFVVVLAVMTLGMTINVVAMRTLVDRLVDASQQIEDVEADNAMLQRNLAAYGDHAHVIIENLSGLTWSVDAADTRVVRTAIESGFGQLIDSDIDEVSVLAERALERWGALDASVVVIVGESAADRLDRHERVDTELDILDDLLAEATAVESAAAHSALADARSLEYVALAAVIGTGVVMTLLMALFAWRMSRRVLQPMDANRRALSHEARHDGLTGLANRTEFAERLEGSLAIAESRGRAVAILFVDLDDFKYVNDTLGHAAGDALLQVVADRISSVVRPEDLVARLGGDEFAVLLHDVGSESGAAMIADRVVMVLAAPAEIAGTTVQVGASVGLAMYTQGHDADQLMRNADVAMYTAKRAGKNRVEHFDVAPRVSSGHSAARPESTATT